MDQTRQASSNVFINKKPAYLHKNSYVDKVKGDEAGVNGGVVTGVNKKISHSKKFSTTVFINGKPMVRTDDMVNMNTKKP